MFETNEVMQGVFRISGGFLSIVRVLLPLSCECCGVGVRLSSCLSLVIYRASASAAISVNGLKPSHQTENMLIVYQPPTGTSGRMLHPKRGAPSTSG